MTTRQAFPPWPHHPRRALAEDCLHRLSGSAMRSMLLAGPSGIGKTSFLTLDLLPLAIARGLRCDYFDLAGSFLSVEPSEGPSAEPVITGQSDSDTTSFACDALRHHAASLLLPSRARTNEPAGTRPIDSADESFCASGSALKRQIDRLFDRDDAPLLLVFDNVDILSQSAQLKLRRYLDARSHGHSRGVACLFAGTSRDTGPLVSPSFSDETSRSPVILLPALDDGFLSTIYRWIEARSNAIAFDELQHALRGVARSARLFRRALAQVLGGDAADLGTAVARSRAMALENAAAFANVGKLNPLQAVVLREVWQSGTELYSATRRSHFQSVANLDDVSKADVQGALKRLERLGLVCRNGHATYAIASLNVELLFELDRLERPAAQHHADTGHTMRTRLRSVPL